MRGVPSGALVSLLVLYLVGILAIRVLGAQDAFEVVLSASAVYVLFGWIAIFVSHLGYRRAVARGDAHAVDFRLPGAPATTWICIVFLVAVALYVMLDFSSANWYYSLIAGALMLVGTNVGYEISRRRLARNGLPDLGEGADD